MKFGLPDELLSDLNEVFARHSAIEHVWLYGSRAMGTYRPGSDIDLAVSGAALTFRDVLALQIDLDDLERLYTFDVQHLEKITNPDLLGHIRRAGVLIYTIPQPVTS